MEERAVVGRPLSWEEEPLRGVEWCLDRRDGPGGFGGRLGTMEDWDGAAGLQEDVWQPAFPVTGGAVVHE